MLVDEARSRTGLEVTLSIKGDRHRIDPLIETVLFRVAQEALTNVNRHALCYHATVDLEYAPERVCVRIHDKGVGFDTGEIHSPPRGWGLEGMRERVDSVGGFEKQGRFTKRIIQARPRCGENLAWRGVRGIEPPPEIHRTTIRRQGNLPI